MATVHYYSLQYARKISCQSVSTFLTFPDLQYMSSAWLQSYTHTGYEILCYIMLQLRISLSFWLLL